MKRILILSAIAISLIFVNCKTIPKDDNVIEKFKVSDKYNLKFEGFDSEIENPSQDKRCYYKIFIDKVEDGRTTTGLESQKKVYETKLSQNRHLMVVEKWVLDEKAGKYVKLNNIDQPKPNFIYFNIPEKRIVIIKMETGRDGKSNFEIDFERE